MSSSIRSLTVRLHIYPPSDPSPGYSRTSLERRPTFHIHIATSEMSQYPYGPQGYPGGYGRPPPPQGYPAPCSSGACGAPPPQQGPCSGPSCSYRGQPGQQGFPGACGPQGCPPSPYGAPQGYPGACGPQGCCPPPIYGAPKSFSACPYKAQPTTNKASRDVTHHFSGPGRTLGRW